MASVDASRNTNVDANKEQPPQSTPTWDCVLTPSNQEKTTVGDVMSLTCTGLESVEILGSSKKEYEFTFASEKENIEYMFFLLGTEKDEINEKKFRVTSYIPVQGDVSFTLSLGEKAIFQSQPIKLQVQSVIKNKGGAQPYGPINPELILPGPWQLGAFVVLIFIAVGYSFFRIIKKARKSADYKRVLLKADYPDPFVDFNIDIRNLLKKNRKQHDHFSEECESAFKKLFFRILKKPVSLESVRSLNFELKRRNVPPHKIRSLFVLRKDYFLLLEQKLNDQEIEDFLNQSKKMIAEIKKYFERGLDA